MIDLMTLNAYGYRTPSLCKRPVHRIIATLAIALCLLCLGASSYAEAPTHQAPSPSDVTAHYANQNGQSDLLLESTFCFLALLLVLSPILRFLSSQWKFRRDRLFGVLANDAIVYYYSQFRPGAKVLRDVPPVEDSNRTDDDCIYPRAIRDRYFASFKKDFYYWYGRRYYVLPVLILILLTIVSARWSEQMLVRWSYIPEGPGKTLRALVASSLAGAFVWVISDALDRLRTRDFTTTDVYYHDFRILMAIPFAWALSIAAVGGSVLGLPVAIPLAFFLGAFPTQTLFTIARRIGTQQLKMGDDQDTGNLELEKLQSIGKSNAERFQDEGITTITSLAYSDPIDLTIRTNFDFNYVVDCVSQALAWIYFGDSCVKLFPLSMRGAQEIYYIVSDADNTESPVKQLRAQQTITAGAQLTNVQADAFRSSLDQIAEDPYTKFLVDIWH